MTFDNPSCVSCGFDLDTIEIRELSASAENGDAQAALRLALHYAANGPEAEELRWFRRAASLGDPVAAYNLWFELRNSLDCMKREEALAWLGKAVLLGNETAVQARARITDSRDYECVVLDEPGK